MSRRIRRDGMIEYSGAFWFFARPQVILPLHSLIVATILALATMRAGGAVPHLVTAFGSGLLLWTLFEYSLHRWVLHHTRPDIVGRIFWRGLHRDHHGYRVMIATDHRGVHPLVSVPVVLGLGAALLFATARAWPLAAFAGWFTGYLLYELLHWVFHTPAPERGLFATRFVRKLREAHEVHHLRSSRRNFGFLTTAWDHAFGTHAPHRDPTCG